MPVPPNKKLFDVIGSLYDAAGSSSAEQWLSIYQQMAALISSGPGGLSLYLPENKEFQVVATTFDTELLEQYFSHYQFVSPFHNKVVGLKSGESFSRAKNYPDKEFQKTPIYQDYFKKQDVFNFEYHVFLEGPAMSSAAVTFSRPFTMKNFSAAEINTMQYLVRHLTNAFQIHVKLSEAQREKLIASESLEKTSQSVIVLNKSGKVCFRTDSAEKLIAAGDGLRISRSGILSATAAQDARKLKLLLQSVFAPTLAESVDYAKFIRISRSSGARPLTVFVSPFYEKSGGYLVKEPLALLFIKDPDEKNESYEPLLSAMYNLTAAEAKLAALLAQGNSINEACRILGVKQNTIRTHLKRVFSKTETARQSELVKLILNSSVNLR